MYEIRVRRPSSSISLRFDVRTFCDIPPTERFSSPNLRVPPIRSLMIRTFHLLPMTDNVTSTGQAGSSILIILLGRGKASPYYAFHVHWKKNPAVISR